MILESKVCVWVFGGSGKCRRGRCRGQYLSCCGYCTQYTPVYAVQLEVTFVGARPMTFQVFFSF